MRAHQKERARTLLWVADDSTASHSLVEAAAHEFALRVRFCPYAELWAQAERCDLVAIELDASPDDALGLLKGLSQRLPRLTLFAVSAETTIGMIRAALEAGATDFLSLPLNAQELHKALIKFTQAAVRPTPAAAANGDVITVYGARGGLGATTIAVNLAVRISALTSAHTALVDLDLQRGDVAAFLNLSPVQSLAAMAAPRGEVDELFLHGTLTRHPSGVFVLPAPAHIEEADAIGRDQVELALRLLRVRFAHTVVDMARTLTDAALAAFEQTEHILVLTDLSIPGVRAARRTIELLARLDTPPERVELLVTEAVPGPVKMEDAVRAIGKQPLMTIPRDVPAATNAMNAGAPLNGTRDSNLAIAITQLAAKLIGAPLAPKSAGGPLLRRLFGRGRRAPA